MVLPVVPEMEAGHKRKPDGHRQARGMVRVGRSGSGPVGQIGTEQKQLQGAEQQGQGAEQQHVPPGRGAVQRAKQGNGAPADEKPAHLPASQVPNHESPVPGQGMGSLKTMKIRVRQGAGGKVMAVMIAATAVPGQTCIDPQGQGADPVVQPGGHGEQRSMHRVMAHDEQARLKQGAAQNRHHDPGNSEIIAANKKQPHQA